MIETYKILSGKYDRLAATPTLPVAGPAVRGHNLRLHKFRARYNLRKYYFTNRVVNIWNALPDLVLPVDVLVTSCVNKQSSRQSTNNWASDEACRVRIVMTSLRWDS